MADGMKEIHVRVDPQTFDHMMLLAKRDKHSLNREALQAFLEFIEREMTPDKWQEKNR